MDRVAHCQHPTCTQPTFFGESLCDDHANPWSRGHRDTGGPRSTWDTGERPPCDQPRLKDNTLCKYHDLQARIDREEREFQEQLQKEIRRQDRRAAGLPPEGDGVDDASPHLMRSDGVECGVDENCAPAASSNQPPTSPQNLPNLSRTSSMTGSTSCFYFRTSRSSPSPRARGEGAGG